MGREVARQALGEGHFHDGGFRQAEGLEVLRYLGTVARGLVFWERLDQYQGVRRNRRTLVLPLLVGMLFLVRALGHVSALRLVDSRLAHAPTGRAELVLGAG